MSDSITGSLEVSGVSVSLGGKRVLDNVSLSANAGEIIAILGPNGAGKSSLLKAIMGLLDVEHGEISVDGEVLENMSPSVRAKTCSYLPQSAEVHWPLLAEHLVALGRLPHSPHHEVDSKAVENALKLADATQFKGRSVFNLSGGERARVLLARALAVEAPILLADEPVAALDPRHQLEVMEVFRTLAGLGNIILVVLHDINLAYRYAHKICLLDRGELVAFDTSENVIADDKLEEVFGVRLKPKAGEKALLPWALKA